MTLPAPPRRRFITKRPTHQRAVSASMVIGARLPTEQYHELMRYAEANETTVSAILRRASARFLAEAKESA